MSQGYSQRQCFEISVKEYQCLLDGFAKKEYREWERVRWMAFMNIQLSPDIKAYNKPKRPQDLFKLPTDEVKKSEPVIVTDEDIEILKQIGFFNYGNNREHIC